MQTHQTSAGPGKLLDQVRDRLRALHYSARTEGAYVFWIRRHILFHGKRHPIELGRPEAEAFLTSLAVERSHDLFEQRGQRARRATIRARCKVVRRD